METVVDEQLTDIPEDFREFTKYRDAEQPAQQTEKAPAAGEEATPSSEPADEAGQIAAESETAEEAQQTEAEPSQDPKPDDERDTRMSRRMRKLTGTIAELQTRIDELTKEPDAEEEATAEVASAPEPAAPAEKLSRPMLKDFEDNDETGETAWDQYEAARETYHEQKTARALQTALDKHKADLAKQAQDLELKHAKETADREWSKAASRYPDFNEVLRPEVQISQAMEAVMRMDPESGTELAYYMGQHPEESKKIAEATLATNEREWGIALARAGMELGKIRANLKPPVKGAAPSAKPPAATPQPKKVTAAHKPPTNIRPGAAAPKFDLLNDDDAADTGKWMKERNRQLAIDGKR